MKRTKTTLSYVVGLRSAAAVLLGSLIFQLGLAAGVDRLEAESFDKSQGIDVRPEGPDYQKVADIHDGDWILFEDVDLRAGISLFG